MGVAAVIVSHATDIELVERALTSVLNQTYPVDEIVIIESKKRLINDLTELVRRTDREILLRYCYYYNASESRNRGALFCTSEFICFLDGDDEWYPNMIEDRMALMDDDVCMVTSAYIRVTDSEGGQAVFTPSVPSGSEIFGGNVIGSNSFVLLRREPFIELMGFDHHLVYHQDWDLWVRMLERGKVAIAPGLGGIKHYNPFSASHNTIVCRDGWTGFVRKWMNVYRREHKHLDSVEKAFRADMSRFFDFRRPIFGPFGFMRMKVLNKLPSWVIPDFRTDRDDYDRLMSREEIMLLKKASENVESDEPKIIYLMHPLFEKGKLRLRSCSCQCHGAMQYQMMQTTPTTTNIRIKEM